MACRCVAVDHYVPAAATSIGAEGINWSTSLGDLRDPQSRVLVAGGDVIVSGGCESYLSVFALPEAVFLHFLAVWNKAVLFPVLSRCFFSHPPAFCFLIALAFTLE
jgi:hypothetical protein